MKVHESQPANTMCFIVIGLIDLPTRLQETVRAPDSNMVRSGTVTVERTAGSGSQVQVTSLTRNQPRSSRVLPGQPVWKNSVLAAINRRAAPIPRDTADSWWREGQERLPFPPTFATQQTPPTTGCSG